MSGAVDRQTRRYLATNSTAWRAIRQAHLDVEPHCRICEREGRLTLGVHVDHINGRADRREDYYIDNLQTLCQVCHSRKTRAQQLGLEYAPKGCDGDGLPIDPCHHWHTRH